MDSRKVSIIASLGLIFLSSVTQAEQKWSNQDMSSGPGVYRIELRNLGLLKAFENAVGDPESPGELHSIHISLNNSARQSHSFTETSPLLYNFSRGIMGGSGYVPLHGSDMIRLGQRRGNSDAYNLWVHGRYDRDDKLRFKLAVTAKELDCSRQRVCRRSNIGVKALDVVVPAFRTMPPRNCTADNTFRLTRVDNKTVLQRNNNRLIGSNPTLKSRIKSDYRIDNFKSGGPFLSITNADICIARTW